MPDHVHTWTKVLTAKGVYILRCTGCGTSKPA